MEYEVQSSTHSINGDILIAIYDVQQIMRELRKEHSKERNAYPYVDWEYSKSVDCLTLASDAHEKLTELIDTYIAIQTGMIAEFERQTGKKESFK